MFLGPFCLIPVYNCSNLSSADKKWSLIQHQQCGQLLRLRTASTTSPTPFSALMLCIIEREIHCAKGRQLPAPTLLSMDNNAMQLLCKTVFLQSVFLGLRSSTLFLEAECIEFAPGIGEPILWEKAVYQRSELQHFTTEKKTFLSTVNCR